MLWVGVGVTMPMRVRRGQHVQGPCPLRRCWRLGCSRECVPPCPSHVVETDSDGQRYTVLMARVGPLTVGRGGSHEC